MKWKKRTLDAIAEMVCGTGIETPFSKYRSSSYLTRFFEDVETGHKHDGTTRAWWVSGVLEELIAEPTMDTITPPGSIQRVIQVLMDAGDASENDPGRTKALEQLNKELQRERASRPSMLKTRNATFVMSGRALLLATPSTRIGRLARRSSKSVSCC